MKKDSQPQTLSALFGLQIFVVGSVCCCLKLLFEKKKFMGTPQVFDRCDILRICFLYFRLLLWCICGVKLIVWCGCERGEPGEPFICFIWCVFRCAYFNNNYLMINRKTIFMCWIRKILCLFLMRREKR